jgi:hypothetical protein
MRNVLVRKISLHDSNDSDDLKDKSPQELLGMMWQLALNAWSFKENLNVEPRLQRHVVVLKRRRG